MLGSLDDLKSHRFWRAVIAEFIGTWFLVLVGCGTCLGDGWEDVDSASRVEIAISFGLIVATMVWCIAHISGGHINPAVTCAMMVARKISLAKAVFFTLSQCIGATVGASILKSLTPHNYNGTLGMTTVQKHLETSQGFGVEVLITFVLVFTVFSSCDKKRTDLNGSTPLTIGFSVGVCHFFAVKFTGSSMNPARTFGPAIVTGIWKDHWVYWIGPILGGIIAGLLYEFVFAEDASLAKIKSFFTSVDYGKDEYDVTSPNNKDQKSPKQLEAEIAM